MQTQGNAREHFLRVVKMAKATQVDLSTALDDGAISLDDYAGMITKCQGCTQVDKCDGLLARMPDLDAAPKYCANRDAFVALRGN